MLRRKKQKQQPGRLSRDQSAKNAPVFSYYSSRNREAGSSQRSAEPSSSRRQHSRWIGYLPSLLSAAAVLFSLMYVTTLSTTPRIEVISNNQPAVIQTVKTYESAAESQLKKSLLNRSKLTIDTDKIAKELQAQFPELGDIVVTVPLIGRRPVIEMQPATPVLVLSSQNGTYVIDDRGRPVLEASRLASSVRDKLPVVSDDSGTLAEIGKQLLTTDLVKFVSQVDAQFKAKQQRVESYSLPARANELHVRLTGKSYHIKFNTEVEARLQAGTYFALSEKLAADGIIPAEYIDVRVEERAYYK